MDNSQLFKEAMLRNGVICHDPIIADGKFHKFFHSGIRKKSRSAWYIFHGNYGSYGDFSQAIEKGWSIDNGEVVTQSERKIRKEQDALRAEGILKTYEETSKKTAKIWFKLSETGGSSYLQRKKVDAFGIRFSRNQIIIPVRDIDGKIWSFQRIFNNGDKRFFAGGKKQCCFHVIGTLEDGKPFFCVEGYATGASVYMATGITTVIAFDAGNLEPVIKAIKNKYSQSPITIAADNDQWKERNTGKEKAEEAAAKHGCMIVLPQFPDTVKRDKPTDFNDLHCLVGSDEVRKQLTHTPPPPPTKEPATAMPRGFFMRKDGLYYQQNEDTSYWICSPLYVKAHVREETGENWGKLLEWKDPDGTTHKWTMPLSMLAGESVDLRAQLMHLGLNVSTSTSNRNRLNEYIQTANPTMRAKCTSRIGWHGASRFVLPDRVFPDTEPLYLQSDSHNFRTFKTKGTLESWQQAVAIPSRGNSRLVFGLSCAFAAPLLHITGSESGGFNLKGKSSSGKSTSLVVAGSVWGGGSNNGFIQSWRSTSNALEAVAEAHNDCLLCLDELGQIDGREAGEVSYMLTNGTGKNRSKSRGGLRKAHEWRLLFLSTGEISLSDKINEGGKRVQAGMQVRLVDIPADIASEHGIFDTLNGFASGDALSSHLKEAATHHYGTAIREFLTHIVAHKDKLVEQLNGARKAFQIAFVPDNADGQVSRVAGRFALVATAGELAIQIGVLPYNQGEVIQAVGTCFKAWLDDRGSVASLESEQGIAHIRAFFESNAASRFATMEDIFNKENRIINQAGFKRKNHEGHYEFFVYPQVFQKEICKGMDHKAMCHELVKLKMLVPGDGNRFVKNQRLPEVGVKKMYCFTSSMMADADMEVTA
ncbi:MAG: DUF927 domain-containing protein [Alphaproteobacteria bacterium]|nr:DUF927 domain-containing protein [Alphaproteobacteria bacterium]